MSAETPWFLSVRHRLGQFCNIWDQTLVQIGPNFHNYNCFKNMFIEKTKVQTFICRARVFNISSHFLFTCDSLQIGEYFTPIFTCYKASVQRTGANATQFSICPLLCTTKIGMSSTNLVKTLLTRYVLHSFHKWCDMQQLRAVLWKCLIWT